MLDRHIWSELDQPPKPYQTDKNIWTEPHLAAMMLEAHLDQKTDAASYRPETIDAICAFLPVKMQLSPAAAIIDLGCGPGLYCARLSSQGYQMTGLDQSQVALDYARTLPGNQNTHLIQASYLEPFGDLAFDAALLIYEDYGVLGPPERQTLLKQIDRALKPGGWLALDVCSQAAFRRHDAPGPGAWSTPEAGFWRPHPHLLLEKSFHYPDVPASCDLYVVIDEKVSIYRVFQTYFDPDGLCRELAAGGFVDFSIYADLTGQAYQPDAAKIGMVCRKPSTA